MQNLNSLKNLESLEKNLVSYIDNKYQILL